MVAVGVVVGVGVGANMISEHLIELAARLTVAAEAIDVGGHDPVRDVSVNDVLEVARELLSEAKRANEAEIADLDSAPSLDDLLEASSEVLEAARQYAHGAMTGGEFLNKVRRIQ